MEIFIDTNDLKGTIKVLIGQTDPPSFISVINRLKEA